MEARNELECIVEAMLFAAGEPVVLDSLCKALELEPVEVTAAVEGLRQRYEEEHRGMQILTLENAFQMTTRPEYYPQVQKLFRSGQKITLSETQLETLAIIAYKQPVTKQEIEDIRGVRSDAVVNRLVEYNLIAEKGRRKSPGRPVLFGTTDEFLRNFGYSGIKDLPHLDPANAEELEQIHQQEIAQFGEPQPAEPVKKPRPDAGDPFP